MKLRNLIDGARDGKVVLPEFQRSFIWEPEDVRELLVSVMGNYFIGSMLILRQSKDNSPFALRLIEGITGREIQSLVEILLDGQQRATALYYALYEPELPLKGKKNPYKFYLDLEEALKENWNDAVIAVSMAHKNKLSEIEKGGSRFIPFRLLGDLESLTSKFKDHPYLGKIVMFSNRFMEYEIHTVPMDERSSIEKIAETFERINRTGEPLSMFELLTARLFRHGINLRNLLDQSDEEFLDFINKEYLLKVIALIRGKEPKRKNLLKLEPDGFETDWKAAVKYMRLAYSRMTDIKNGYGIFDFGKWAPYSTMIVPLAAMIKLLKEGQAESPDNYEKLDAWYWSSVFGNRYDQAVDSTSFSDLTTMKGWVRETTETPDFIKNFHIESANLSVKTQGSAIYRGMMNLVTLRGALDFKTGLPPQFEPKKVQDDHIFPKSVYESLYRNDVDLVLNRTLISTNREKSNTLPSKYFGNLLKKHGEQTFNKIMTSHLISEHAIKALLRDDLEAFIKRREKDFLKTINGLVKKG